MIYIFILLLLAFSSDLTSQIDKSMYYSYGKSIHLEYSAIQSENSEDSIEVIILFRLNFESIPFIKIYGDNRGTFVAVPNIEVTCKDENGITKFRTLWTDSVFAKSYEATISKNEFVSGFSNFQLAKAKYSVNANLSIKGSSRQTKAKIDINPNEIASSSNPIGKPIFSHFRSSEQIKMIQPFILENNMLYGSEGGRIIIPIFSKLRQLNYNFIFYKLGENDSKEIVHSGTAEGKFGQKPNFISIVHNLFFNLEKTPNNDLGYLDIIFPGIKTNTGQYLLQVVQEKSLDTLNFKFKIIWENEPISIRKVDYAIECMYYILTDEEFEDMNLGSDKEKRAKFEKYWKDFDPTPETPYNEALAQFFERVDYAFFNFQTLQEKDGAKTDRGKIYILYGPPLEVTEDFIGSNTKITWKYPQHKKSFVFETISPTVFKLKEIIDF